MDVHCDAKGILEKQPYNGQTLAQCLHTRWMGKSLAFYEILDSTNAQAQEAALNGAPDGMLVVADSQTAGRGRRGRQWSSPAGSNIYFTLVLKPDFSPDKASMLTLLMAYAVKAGMEKTFSVPVAGADDGSGTAFGVLPEIKWPNDIVINGRKVCGILTEMCLEQNRIGHVVIGVGINVGRQSFTQELADKATDLETECGYPISRSRLLVDILEAFEREYEEFLQRQSLAEFKEKYNSCLVNRDREVCVLDPKGEYSGIARGINDAGELLVELADGSITAVYAGEVSVRGIYGYV